MTAKLKLVEPRHVNRQVAVRPPNAELRPREYLTVAEVEAMIKAAKAGRHGHRMPRSCSLPSATACGRPR